jgi:hypothetical protein
MTPASVWQAAAGRRISDDLLEWPPDVFALTGVLLERSQAHRFAMSPPGDSSWPPYPGWPAAVADAGRRWSHWVENRGPIPELMADAWRVLSDIVEEPLARLTFAHDWRACEALLTLHAIADEACAGLGVALTASDGMGCCYRARGRELLARTGSLARIPPHLFRVLPKVRTAPHGTTARALSRYVCVHGPDVEVLWHKVHDRRPGTEPRSRHTNFLLLPWPLRVRESDFHPVPGSVQSLAMEPYGLFEFAPSERLDFDLVDRMLIAARDEVDRVDVVCLPESAVDAGELDELEALLRHHEVTGLITGVRERAVQPGQLPVNWVHIGVSAGEQWMRMRQNKHHRWSLDEQQIYQYHLGGSLRPHIRWWEAMDVPRRSLQFLDVGDGVTMACLVCEDLAQIDEVADLLRSVGPTIVITPLLDGPQLSSRWAARYASVLADDPGSAVLTLTSFGMARRSRPRGRDSSPVVALWRDPARGTREIPLEAGAHGVLLSASHDLTLRRSGDGRTPVENCTEFFDVGIYQVAAASPASAPPPSRPASPMRPVLEADELTILTSWAEAVAEALAGAPDRVEAVLADAAEGGSWRAALGIAEPSPPLNQAISSIAEVVRIAIASGDSSPLDALLLALSDSNPAEQSLDKQAHEVLGSALEQRKARQAHEADARPAIVPTTEQDESRLFTNGGPVGYGDESEGVGLQVQRHEPRRHVRGPGRALRPGSAR